jgi:large subunit ribosomal protein L4
MKVDVLNIEGKKTSSVELKDEAFGKVNAGLIYEVVKMQRASKRAGTASTKDRSEVSGGGVKPWRQKGSGRARSGSTRSPIWRHGGVCFGPKPRDYSYTMPAKAVDGALRSALKAKVDAGKLKVYDKITLASPKTRELAEILGKGSISSALIVAGDENRNLELASRNLKGFKFIYAAGLNVYDVLRYDELVMTRDAFDRIEARLS